MKEDKSLRILVVDDHEMFREQVCVLLRRQPGFEVICEAANGLEGVSRARSVSRMSLFWISVCPVLAESRLRGASDELLQNHKSFF